MTQWIDIIFLGLKSVNKEPLPVASSSNYNTMLTQAISEADALFDAHEVQWQRVV
jgi:hypothetical protein